MEDGIAFEPASVKGSAIRKEAGCGGARIDLQAKLNGARIVLQVDIGFGDAVSCERFESAARGCAYLAPHDLVPYIAIIYGELTQQILCVTQNAAFVLPEASKFIRCFCADETSKEKNYFLSTALPYSSMPWPWNTIFARSMPTVVIFMMDAASGSSGWYASTLAQKCRRRVGPSIPLLTFRRRAPRSTGTPCHLSTAVADSAENTWHRAH